MVEVAARGFYLDFFFFMVFTDWYRMLIPILHLFARPPLYLALLLLNLTRSNYTVLWPGLFALIVTVLMKLIRLLVLGASISNNVLVIFYSKRRLCV